MVACPLVAADDHSPSRAVYDALAACSSLMLVQLAGRRPIRGGIDVGAGIEVDGEFFGAALVKAYELESHRAKYPRVVVGDTLVGYLQSAERTPGESLEERCARELTRGALSYIRRDSDGEWILDYAGSQPQKDVLSNVPGAIVLQQARRFAHEYRAGLRERTDDDGRKLFERYSQLVRYLDASGA